MMGKTGGQTAFSDAEIDASAGTDAGPPLDIRHLARQTMDDREIEAEVLALFVRQAMLARHEIARKTGEERARLAHTLKGAACGVGAFAVARSAEALEENPDEVHLIPPLVARIGEVCDFIATLRR